MLTNGREECRVTSMQEGGVDSEGVGPITVVRRHFLCLCVCVPAAFPQSLCVSIFDNKGGREDGRGGVGGC